MLGMREIETLRLVRVHSETIPWSSEAESVKVRSSNEITNEMSEHKSTGVD